MRKISIESNSLFCKILAAVGISLILMSGFVCAQKNQRESLCSPNKNIYGFAALDEKNLYVITETYANSITFKHSLLASNNGGKTWTIRRTSAKSNPDEIYFLNKSTGFLAESENESSVLSKTTDGGKTWKRLLKIIPGYIQQISFINDKIGFAIGYDETFLKTLDGGDSWEFSRIPVKDIWSVSFRDASNGWILTGKNDIFRTKDGGKTWVSEKEKFFKILESQKPTTIEFRTMKFLDDKKGYLGVGYLRYENETEESRRIKEMGIAVFSTDDGGETWKSNLVTNDFTLKSAFFAPNQPFWLIPGLRLLEDSFFISDDEGKTWRRQPRKNVDFQASEIYFVNNKIGWIKANVGIYGKDGENCLHRTIDGGKTWR